MKEHKKKEAKKIQDRNEDRKRKREKGKNIDVEKNIQI